MTSKEALETLFEILCEREHTNSEHNFWLKLFNDVARDLEILEILKQMLEVKKGNTWFYLDTKHSFFDTQEQLDLVKEFLKNDK